MNREDFFEWMNTCPALWLVVQDDSEGTICISFYHIEEYEEQGE